MAALRSRRDKMKPKEGDGTESIII